MSDTSSVDPTASAPAGANGLDMASIMNTYNTALSQVKQSATDLTDALGVGKAGIQQEQQGSQAATKAQQEINTIKGAAAAKEQADTSEAAAHFGTNPHAASYSIGDMADEVLALHNDISQRRDAISKKLDVGFTDDPIQWMVNQFTIPMDVYAANVKIDKANADLGVIHELEQATREQAATNAMLDQGDAAVLADRQNKVLAAQAQINLGKSQQQLAALGIQGVTLKDAISKTQLESMFQLNNAISEKERIDLEISRTAFSQSIEGQRLELDKARLGLGGQRFDLDKQIADNRLAQQSITNPIQLQKLKDEEARLELTKQSAATIETQRQESILRTKLIIEEKQTSDANKLDIQQKLNSFTSSMGMAPVTFDQFKGMQGRMRDILEQGILDPDTYSGRIPGASRGPATAIDLANAINAPLTPGMNDIRNKLGKVTDVVAGDNPTLAGKPELDTLKNAAIGATVNQQIKNIPTESSIYSPMSLKSLITASPAIQDNPLIPYLANQAIADELYPTNPNDMFNAAYKAVGEGKMTIDQATTSITELYKTMQLQLNQVKQYKRFGLPMLDQTSGYKQSVYIGQGFGSTRIVDLTDPADVANALTRSIIGKNLIDATGALGAPSLVDQSVNQLQGKVKKPGVQ